MKCFRAGTLVLTEKGHKKIEEIELGDKVWAFNEKTGKWDWKEVVRLFKGEPENQTEEWCHVYINGEKITSTPGHKYYLPDNKENRELDEIHEHESYDYLSVKWVSARNLKKGDKVLFSDGRYGIIDRVEIEKLKKPEATFNLEVKDFHTYSVGLNGVCVHNAKCHGKEWAKERGRYWKGQGEKYSGNAHGQLSDSGTYNVTQRNWGRMLKSKAPIGLDNKSVVLHHKVGISIDFYDYYEITRTAHYA